MSRTDDDSWDITESVGATALSMAGARAAETGSDCPLFTDRYAQFFVDAAVESGWQPTFTDQMLAGYTAARTKYFDDFFTTAGANGLDQVVILASGLDSRAWRLPWISETVVYEIDQPKVLEFKARVLEQHGARPVARYAVVPVDLRHDWPEVLRQAGFDSSRPTAWSAEGLLPYLSADNQELLFERIDRLSAYGSRIAVEAFYSPEPRADVTEWLQDHGWEVTAVGSRDLMANYQRPAPEDLGDAVPDSVFVEGNRT